MQLHLFHAGLHFLPVHVTHEGDVHLAHMGTPAYVLPAKVQIYAGVCYAHKGIHYAHTRVYICAYSGVYFLPTRACHGFAHIGVQCFAHTPQLTIVGRAHTCTILSTRAYNF